MSLNSDVKELLESFNAYRVKYLVVGGYAVSFHAEPRYTKDFDVWVKADKENAAKVFQALRDFGAPLARHTAADFAEEHYFFRMGVEPNAIDVLMSVSGLEFDKAWQNRVEVDYHGGKVHFISKEDLIAAKLAAGRPRDLLDAETLRNTRDWQDQLKEPVKERKQPQRTGSRKRERDFDRER